MAENFLSINNILAVVTLKENERYVGGGAPIFFVDDKKELEMRSMLIARITLGMVHDLGDNIKIIVSH